MGVKLFLHELYPSPLTGDTQSTSKQGQMKKKKGKISHSQLIPCVIILLTHILKQNYCRIAHSETFMPISLIHKNTYKISLGTLIANSVTEHPGTANAQMGGEHSVESPGRANVVASEQSGNSTQMLPGLSTKNAKMAAATTETSTATPSAYPPPPTSVG